MPIVGIEMRSVISDASSSGTHSRTIAKHQPSRIIGIFSLQLEAADDIDRLRSQTDVSHHWDLCVEDGLDGFDPLRFSAFDLHGLGAGADECSRVAHRLFGRDVVRQVRHVADDERVLRASGDGSGVMDHLVHGYAQRVGIAEDHHAEGVADEDDVGAGGVGDFRGGIVVCGEHPDALHALHRFHRGDGHALLFCHFASSRTEED